MKLLAYVLLATASAVAGGGLLSRALQKQQPAAGVAQDTAPVQSPAPANQEINDRFVKQFSEIIAGRQDEPAEKVFKNIQWLKGVPAGRFLSIMNGGYSRSLGVSCTHCHVERDFASDEKRPKRAAREMAVMHRMINQQLAQMQNLGSPADKRAISCIMCHRGKVTP